MKSKYLLEICVLALVGVFVFRVDWAKSELQSIQPTSTSVPSELSAMDSPWSDETTTEVVVSFYKVLMQKEAPTLEQEKELLTESSGLRKTILSRQKGGENKPVILQLFRQHKDLFLPANMKKLSDIQVSSPFGFVRNLERTKTHRKVGGCNVMVLFLDKEAKPARFHSIVFDVSGGKIDPDGISFDGFEGETAYEKFSKK